MRRGPRGSRGPPLGFINTEIPKKQTYAQLTPGLTHDCDSTGKSLIKCMYKLVGGGVGGCLCNCIGSE